MKHCKDGSVEAAEPDAHLLDWNEAADAPLIFDFDTDNISLLRRDEICSFLRAFMKQKCRPCRGIVTLSAPDSMKQQPAWVQTKKVLDTILSFSSFEQQAGVLRLVCHEFKDSSMRLLKAKLEEAKCIGFWEDRGKSFKAWVRQGSWSDDPFATNRKSVVDEALFMISCRCHGYMKCPGKNECPGTKGVVKNGNTVLDLAHVRTLLESNVNEGWVQLSSERKKKQEVLVNFSTEDRSIFEIYDLVKKNSNTMPRTAFPPYGIVDGTNGPVSEWSGGLTRERFLRSLFLVFLHRDSKTSAAAGSELSNEKRARLGKPSVGTVKSNVDNHIRLKMIVRFYTLAGEPVEILLEGHNDLSYLY